MQGVPWTDTVTGPLVTAPGAISGSVPDISEPSSAVNVPRMFPRLYVGIPNNAAF